MKAHWPIQGCAIFPTNPNFEEQIVFVEPTNYSDNIDEVFFSEDDPKDATYVCTYVPGHSCYCDFSHIGTSVNSECQN